MLATLREALSNVARHTQADRVVVVGVDAGELDLRRHRRRHRAPAPGQASGPRPGQRGHPSRPNGSLDSRAADPGGTVIEWRVPIR
jgi:hypothetical protein